MTAQTSAFVELGIESMDSEHRELVRLLDDFARCIKDGNSTERAHAIVSEAIKCGNAHFEHEEELAAQVGFPEIEEEKFQHRNLRLQFTTLVGDTVANKFCDPVTLEHLKVMRALLDEHISGPDKDLADYLKAAGFK
jgi:hemerythrin-like metal-binding protein